MSPEQTPTKYTKKQRGLMNRSRHLSDHEIMFDGGDYEGDVLQPTRAYIEKILQEHDREQIAIEYVPASEEVSVRQVGHGAVEVVMRHNPDVEQVHRDADKSAEQLSQEKLNLETLLDQTQELLEPYNAGLYADKIPTGRKIRGMITDRPIKTDPWFDDISVNNFDATFRTTLSYKPGKEQNTLDTVSIRMKQRGADEPPKRLGHGVRDEEPMLNLHYSPQGIVSSLDLRQLDMTKATFKNVVHGPSEAQNPAGEFAVKMLRKVSLAGNNVRIETSGSPKVIVGKTDPYGHYDPICEYRYEADKDKFVKYSSRDNSGAEEMSTEEYRDIIKGILRLVPATKVTV